ncbi:CYTH and CHAD domain-containing protein [Rhodopseudomonas boonkerdii]|uniref:CYTH and CHAD domain-containing protein n=1 Tax=Rhodopseudomonas boonkerdii TaxID=475937 RepID=UPI001E3184E1|nr:CYTH and CHAD domain-containing protein [Rhodopseudomonas boonkerdii]UGV28228.1 CYTH and CHAD domain-containing protein [Rhodopseudomonas boonkerdii]
MNLRQPIEPDPAGVVTAIGSGEQAEIELKLLAPQEVLEKLFETPVIVQHARNRGGVRRLETVYYDTADGALFQRGMSLRVRRSGKHFVQTLKLPPDIQEPLARRQWEVPVEGMTPDLAQLPEIGGSVATLTPDALVPAFATRVRRHIRQLDLPDASVEIAFDVGTIEAGTRQQPLSEIELELKSGNAAALFDLGTQLLDAAPLQVGTQSKAERGYALAFDAMPRAKDAAPVNISVDHTVDDVVTLLMGACWHHLLSNHAVAEQAFAPESVHQMRIALRRLRTICTLFRHKIPSHAFETINSEAKWLMRQLGPTRDWDVCATMIASRVATTTPEVDFAGLSEAIEQQRMASHGRLQSVLDGRRYNRFLLTLGDCIERRSWRSDIDADALAALSQPMPPLADRILSRLRRKALKRGTHFRHLDIAALHDLRIELKKLRYATEFFSPLYAHHAPVKRYVARLARLQKNLGRICDIASIRRLLGSIQQDEHTALDLAVGTATGWQTRDGMAATKTLRKRWRRFKAAPAFWRQ